MGADEATDFRSFSNQYQLEMFLASLFFGRLENEPDWILWGVPISSINLLSSVRMLLRAILILMAADGLSASVNITEIAGLLERGGLRGLGFSLGIAFNLLPDLRHSSAAAWHSLRMRGGLRAKWQRGLQLLLVTVFTNALRHAEEIMLAAEVRAFRPERSRIIQITNSRGDRKIDHSHWYSHRWIVTASSKIFLFKQKLKVSSSTL